MRGYEKSYCDKLWRMWAVSGPLSVWPSHITFCRKLVVFVVVPHLEIDIFGASSPSLV
jgi:hypothetical protein